MCRCKIQSWTCSVLETRCVQCIHLDFNAIYYANPIFYSKFDVYRIVLNIAWKLLRRNLEGCTQSWDISRVWRRAINWITPSITSKKTLCTDLGRHICQSNTHQMSLTSKKILFSPKPKCLSSPSAYIDSLLSLLSSFMEPNHGPDLTCALRVVVEQEREEVKTWPSSWVHKYDMGCDMVLFVVASEEVISTQCDWCYVRYHVM